MQIGNPPVPTSSYTSQTRQPQRESGRDHDAVLPPVPGRKPAPAPGPSGRLDEPSGALGQRVLNPAFTPAGSHTGQYAVDTYRRIDRDAAGPELLPRLDVSA